VAFGSHVDAGALGRHACPAAAAALLFGAGVTAGCGGGGGGGSRAAATTKTPVPRHATALGRSAYDATMRPLGRRLAQSVQSLFPLVEARPGTEVAKTTVARLERTKAVVVDVTARVAAIPAPPAIRSAHRRLVSGLESLRAELDELIHVLQVGTSKPFGVYTRFTSLQTIARARNEIERKGFAIG